MSNFVVVPVDELSFYTEKHKDYIRKVSSDTDSLEYLATQHLRMSGVYWGLTAMDLLGVELRSEPAFVGLLDWIMSAYYPDVGGFGGNVGHDPHILYTLSAIQILALFDEMSLLDKPKIVEYVASLQQEDGSFFGDQWGEVDTRFSYCALSILSLLGELNSGAVDVDKAVDFVSRCKNFDGGFGAVPGAESHAGQIFCCVGALSIAGALDKVDVDLLGWWLSERQCDSGGLNGRPEKQADVCYSWWILSTLSILGRTSWIDCDRLAAFILRAQDEDDGGIADRPDDMADIFHTFFGLCGLTLVNYFNKKAKGGGYEDYLSFKGIDPTYCLTLPVVQRLGLKSQVYDELQI